MSWKYQPCFPSTFFGLSDEVIKDVVYKTGFKSFLAKKFLTQFKSGIAIC